MKVLQARLQAKAVTVVTDALLKTSALHFLCHSNFKSPVVISLDGPTLKVVLRLANPCNKCNCYNEPQGGDKAAYMTTNVSTN